MGWGASSELGDFWWVEPEAGGVCGGEGFWQGIMPESLPPRAAISPRRACLYCLALRKQETSSAIWHLATVAAHNTKLQQAQQRRDEKRTVLKGKFPEKEQRTFQKVGVFLVNKNSRNLHQF